MGSDNSFVGAITSLEASAAGERLRQADINKAVQVARGVAGVTSVKNDMRLK